MALDTKQHSALFKRDYVIPKLVATTKHAAIDELVDLLDGHPHVTDLPSVRSAVHERETLMSTGVGLGLGLPHAKTIGVSDTVVAVGISQHGVEFDSVDGLPVRIVFLLVGPEKARSEHIKILSWISRMMNREDVREALAAANSKGRIIKILKEADDGSL